MWKFSPLTIKFIFNFIFGSVFIWHSYCPWSSILTFVMRRLQSVASTAFSWFTLNLLSAVNVTNPAVRICKSLFRIQNTIRSARLSIRHDRITVDPSMTETVFGTLRNCGNLETLSSCDAWALSRNKYNVNEFKCQATRSGVSQGYAW